MANTLNGNTWYVDTAHAGDSDDLQGSFLVYYVVVTATAANAVIELADPQSGATKIKLGVPTSGASESFPFETLPLRFPNGIEVKTLTNAVATLIGSQSKGS